jgi:four helix bundle protein
MAEHRTDRPDEPSVFDHERLDVYQVAIEALAGAAVLARRIPARDSFMRSQLLRACTSVCFNIAEGSGEFSPAEKARFYRIARRSAAESASILDALRVLGLAKPVDLVEVKRKLSRVSAMLTRMIQTRTGQRD